MTQMRKLVFALFAGAALAACSGGGGGGNGPTITSFTATPSSLPAGGGSVTLAWAVTGATSLSIDQSVGAVTPVTTGNKSVQVTASTVFTLTATGSSGNSTMTASVTVAPSVTVNGTVTDTYGAIAPGQTVLITNTSAGFSQSVLTSATGTFSVANVPAPYDATVLDSGGNIVVKYLGLTRADPTLLDLVIGAMPQSASLSGQLSGGTFPETTGYSTSMFFGSPQTNLNNGSISVPTSGAYSKNVSWAGPTNTTGTLYALQTHKVSSLPVDYSYGTLSGVLLQNMGTLVGQNVALNTVPTGTLSGTVSVPSGYTLTDLEAFLVPAPGVVLNAFSDSSVTTSFTYTAPSIASSSLTLLFEASGAGDLLFKQSGVSASTTGLTPTFLAPPAQTLPVDSATGVTVTTPFSWAASGTAYLLIATTSPGPKYYVFTTATTTTIPDLSSAGVQLPASTSYNWSVVGLSPQTSVDSLAVPGGFFGLVFLADGTFSESPDRSFTTSP
jgi:Carboxypeptidase regulatory-like domain